MPRFRTNDPSNLPALPNATRDATREKLLVAEFQRRLEYLTQHYRLGRQILGDDLTFNVDLARLKRAVTRKRHRSGLERRLHPEIEIVISHYARGLAAEEETEVGARHVRKAAVIASTLLRPRAGRPDDPILEHHVTGLVALIQEASGLPVIARRYRNSVYDPHFADGVSRIVPMQFEDRAAGLTEARLVRIVERVRARYAGKPLRFLELFPGYGSSARETATELQREFHLEAFQPNFPIFCH